MKRYALVVALVLVAGTSAWGYGLDCYNTNPCLTRCYTPGPCYQPPICQPCQPALGVTSGSISSSQNVTLAAPCSMGYAANCGSLIIWDKGGCYPTRPQVQIYSGAVFEMSSCNPCFPTNPCQPR